MVIFKKITVEKNMVWVRRNVTFKIKKKLNQFPKINESATKKKKTY